MKHIQIILGLLLFASVSTFAQSPRIKLNQITKDTVKGSVLISSPSDSGMVYSRDFYIAYGADTVLILYGDTLAATSGIISSVLSDGVTITGDGTTGNELKVDTATVISTIQGLIDSLSNYVTLSGTETITGAKTFTNTFTQSGGDANFDNNTLFVDESENRVGIGTTTPSVKLQVSGNGNADETTLLLDNNGTGADNLLIINATGTDNTSYAGFFLRLNNTNEAANYIQSNYYVLRAYSKDIGFNLDGYGYVMEIKQNGDVVIPNAYTKTTGSGGDLYVDTDGTLYRSTSSIRYKKNIQDYDKGINKVLQLKPVYYEKINNNRDVVYAGFIAEQVDEIGLNEFVLYDTEGKADAVHYESITALLTKAIQEQQAIIETQQSEIDQLKTLITDLTNRIQILENK